jgi:two-component system, chemotaxis family, chemotaxis protein CheY
MKKLVVMCVDDERDILTSLEYDLENLLGCIEIELCESAEEAIETIDMLEKGKEQIALLITDQMMPGSKGSDLLADLNDIESVKKTKAILLTGQASHEDTISAVNTHRLNAYIGKPWSKEDLLSKAKELLTDYVIENEIPPQPYIKYLDGKRLLEAVVNLGDTE